MHNLLGFDLEVCGLFTLWEALSLLARKIFLILLCAIFQYL